ncbi:keratin, type I cytoskeletal 10-like [Impatiens glandulifera]|uniref:keratin, type I cytoskeletal 10-like n=1 Tax=Impatiens glandulifera TaxID=253017 RepID=UPI001FB10B03|nr:keratin, type I cytoskeletal 10-like [Impatiens glandulifera]
METVQTPNEKEVVISPVVRTEEAHENDAEASHKRNLYERFQRAERELEEEKQNKTGNESEKGEFEQSLQIHTKANPIQSMAKEDRKEDAECVKILKELDNTLKKNTYETHVANLNFSKFEKKLFSQQSEMMSLERQINFDNHREVLESMELYKNQLIEIQGSLRRTYGERLEYADSITRKFQEKENVKAAAEREQSRITQGEPSRRGDGVSTGTRSKRAPTNDENPRPTKRGGGRSGGNRGGRRSSGGRDGKSGYDQGGRASGGDRGGRSSRSGRGGRALPPFRNLLTGKEMTGEEMSYEGTRFPIDPQVKREDNDFLSLTLV